MTKTARPKKAAAPAAKPNRKAAEVKAELLAATVSLLAERLPAAISVRDIAARANLQHSLINRHFGTKDQLIAEAIDALTTEYAAAVSVADTPVDSYLLALSHLRANLTAALALGRDRAAPVDADEGRQFPGYATHLQLLLAAGAPDNDHTRLVAGFLLALVAGWAFLGDNFVEAAHLDDPTGDAVAAQLTAVLTAVAFESIGTSPNPKTRRSTEGK